MRDFKASSDSSGGSTEPSACSNCSGCEHEQTRCCGLSIAPEAIQPCYDTAVFLGGGFPPNKGQICHKDRIGRG